MLKRPQQILCLSVRINGRVTFQVALLAYRTIWMPNLSTAFQLQAAAAAAAATAVEQ